MLISVFQNLCFPVFTIDENENFDFLNQTFIKFFGEIKNFKRFKNMFDFEVCVIDTEKNFNFSPFDFCHKSESFSAIVKFQNQHQSKQFLMSSFCFENKRVFFLQNVAIEEELMQKENEIEELKQKNIQLEIENKKNINIKQDAQIQALKTNIINRINMKIRQTIDLDEILDASVREIVNLFGGFKAFYADYNKKYTFKINNIYPRKYSNQKGEKFVILLSEMEKLANGKSIMNFVLKEHEKSKKFFPSKVNRIIIPIYHREKMLGILCVFCKQNIKMATNEDIINSIQIQLSQAILQANLFEKIKETNKQLRKTLKELRETQLHLVNSEKMASIGQLVAGVAHEINTPVASIKSNSNLRKKLSGFIKEKGFDEKLLKRIEHLDSIDEEAIKRISNIVLSLKKFVRLDEAQIQYTNINNEIDLTLQLLKHQIKNRIKILRKYGPLPQIKCYPNLLNQVLMNLFMNAIQSIDNEGEIEIETKIEDSNLKIIIKDTGIGIDPRIKSKIFQTGFTTKPIGIGTGLGLAISKKIIEKHNGEISFSSKKNKGTSFTISIPVK